MVQSLHRPSMESSNLKSRLRSLHAPWRRWPINPAKFPREPRRWITHGTSPALPSGRLTALSAAYIWPDADPAPQQLHALLLDIKNALKTCSVPPGTQYLAKYPTNASELRQNIASQAYTEADRVLPNEPPRLSEMLRKVVLRTSNKSLARDARASSSGQQPNAVEALLQLMQGMQRVMVATLWI